MPDTTSSSARIASLPPFAHQPSPPEDQARLEPVTAGNIADRHAGLHRLGNNRQFLLGRKPPSARNAGDHFDLRERIVPVETGCSSIACWWKRTCLSALHHRPSGRYISSTSHDLRICFTAPHLPIKPCSAQTTGNHRQAKMQWHSFCLALRIFQLREAISDRFRARGSPSIRIIGIALDTVHRQYRHKSGAIEFNKVTANARVFHTC